jgi:hypothetical protein
MQGRSSGPNAVAQLQRLRSGLSHRPLARHLSHNDRVLHSLWVASC